MGRGRRGRSAYATKNLTQGSIAGNLWFLAWPQMVEGIFNIADQLADNFWAGRFVGFVALAALGAAQSYVTLVGMVRQGLDIAMKALVSRAYGMGNPALAANAVLQALTLTVIFVGLAAFGGSVFTPTLLRVLGVSDEVIKRPAGYPPACWGEESGFAVRRSKGACPAS